MKVLILSRGMPSEKYPMHGIFEFDQARALKKQGVDVAACCLDIRSVRRTRKFGIEVTELEGMPVFKYDIPIGRAPQRISNFVRWCMFMHIYKKVLKAWDKPDIIHAHFGRATGYVAMKAKEKYGIPYVLTEHDSTVHKGNFSKGKTEALKKIYKNANANIAVSAPFEKVLNNRYASNFEYIPNIVDTSAIQLSKQCSKNNFVSIGSLKKGKGFDVLIKAFAQLHDKNAMLKIIGAGEEGNALKTLTNSLGLSLQVEFCGFLPRSKFQNIFDNSLCFVLASRSETFGLVFIEAMAAGLPVIGTRCGGPEGFVTDDVGILVDVDDVDALAAAMKKMIEDKDKYDSEKVRKYAIDNFSPTVVVQKLLALYERVLKIPI